MTRQKMSLDGSWEFWKDPQENDRPESLRTDEALPVDVPAPWQANAGLRGYTGAAWYRRRFEPPESWSGKRRVILGFNAVDYQAEVWLNGQLIGAHQGGYLPFEWDVTEAVVTDGENELVVKVTDRLEDFAHVPHGKQSWYGMISGIWQSVWLESRPEKYIRRLKITPGGTQVRVEAELNQPILPGERLTFEITGPGGESLLTGASHQTDFDCTVPEPQLWEPGAPNLYSIQVAVETLDVADSLTQTFGFRTIETRDGKILLNGKPIYLRAALDQDYYPGTIYTPLSDQSIEDQLIKAQQMGLNCMRVHIKITDPRYYAAADRLGLLIWTEMPNWESMGEDTPRLARETLDGMIRRDWNHPSIIIWTIINENWGTDLTHNAQHRQWLAETYDYLKQQDPYRLVVDNSACWGNFHVKTDLADFHNYYLIPDHYRNWRTWAEAFASRPDWIFAPAIQDDRHWQEIASDFWASKPRDHAPEVQAKGDEPLLVSEFGNWGLPDVSALLECYGGQEPWWFETGHDWGDGIVYPHGVEQRFHDFHLDRIFGSLSGLSRASQNIEYQALKYEIEQIRRHESIAGYVITEFTDVHWESNGLLDMCRNPKAFFKELGTLNADDLIIPDWNRLAYWPGENCEVPIYLSHYSSKDLSSSRLEWHVQGFPDLTGKSAELNPGHASVSSAGTVQFAAPEVSQAAAAQLVLTIFDSQGNVVLQTTQALYFYPRPEPLSIETPIYAPGLEEPLKHMGCLTTGNLDEAGVAIVSDLSDEIYYYAQAGGRVLWLAEGERPQISLLSRMWIAPRKDTPWQGDWANTLSWVEPEGIFGSLPTSGAVDFAFADITPDNVIVGFHPLEFAIRVHAGIFAGWVHKNAALVAERPLGQGRLLVSTFRLSRQLQTHPAAAAMFSDLLRHIAK